MSRIPPAPPSLPPPSPRRLTLASANIQAGHATNSYREYVTGSWNHVLPSRRKRDNLDALAERMAGFDIVGLQESDAGSLRSGFVNQTHYLAERAGFPYWSHQPNRRLAGIAASANGLLCRLEPDEIVDHALPSRIPGRGALLVRYGSGSDALTLAIAHLSLSPRARAAQLAYLGELLSGPGHKVLMGDFNCECDSPEMQSLYRHTPLQPPEDRLPSFPSWQPRRAIDHILVSGEVGVERRWTLADLSSDHLAVAAELVLPPAVGDG
ncbi:MAG TPA: endonuclease/exonuclease/phosphatase family protein [Chiayiivirga sp.]|nr:MAG: EEP domain-containing protein [Ottowia sp.]HPA01235.1 endonuclease/exonuclease/phosphatase family protein [Chiayiivirga sp.]